MVEDHDRVFKDGPSPWEQTQDSPRFQYGFLRYTTADGRTDHYAWVVYGSEPLQGAQLAKALYKDGGLVSVSIRNGTKEDLLKKYKEAKRKRRLVTGNHRPVLSPSHDAVCLVSNGDEFGVYDDENSAQGQKVGTMKAGEHFTHKTIPYILEISSNEGQRAFKRIDPLDKLAWEFSIPNRIPTNGPKKIPVSFKG